MPSPPLSILQSLSPRIAVLTSEDVVKSSQENGCAGLHELLRPWEGGTDRGMLVYSEVRYLLTKASFNIINNTHTHSTPHVPRALRLL